MSKKYITDSITIINAPSLDTDGTNKLYVDDQIASATVTEVNDLSSSVTWANIPIANVPTGTTGSTVALGNHTHTFASLTSKPTTLSGYGVSDTKTNFNAALSDGSFLFTGDVVTNATHTGDVTGATALTLATVNANVGSFTNADVTVNAKGLITAVSSGSAGTSGDMAVIQLRSEAGQSANSTSDVAIQWNTEDEKDTGFTHSTVTNNSRIEADNAGTYLVSGTINYTGTTSNYRLTCALSIRIDGTTTLSLKYHGGYIRATGGADENAISFSVPIKLTAGQYIEILSKRLSDTTGDGTIDAGTSISMVLLSGAIGPAGPAGTDGDMVAADINTLAKLNAIVADATLIDTGDSRLSDARTPTTHNHDSDYLQLTGGSVTGSIDSVGHSFGSTVGASSIDLSKHINLHSNTYGINITASTLNLIASSVNSFSITAAGVFAKKDLDVVGNITVSGTVDGIDIATDVAANTAKISKEDILVTNTNIGATHSVDWSKDVHKLTATVACVFSDTNLPTYPKTITLYVTGAYALTAVAAWNLDLTDYDGAEWNRITIDFVETGFYSADLKVV